MREFFEHRIADGGESFPGRSRRRAAGYPLQPTEDLNVANFGNRFHIVGYQGFIAGLLAVGKNNTHNRNIPAAERL